MGGRAVPGRDSERLRRPTPTMRDDRGDAQLPRREDERRCLSGNAPVPLYRIHRTNCRVSGDKISYAYCCSMTSLTRSAHQRQVWPGGGNCDMVSLPVTLHMLRMSSGDPMAKLRTMFSRLRPRGPIRRQPAPVRRRSIVNDLVTLIVITLMPLLILGAYLAYRNVQSEQETVYAAAIGHARSTAGRADEVIAETQALLTGISRSPTLRGGDPEQVRALLREIKASYPYYDDLLATDTTGIIYASASSRAGEASTVIDWTQFQAVVRDQQVALSEVQISPRTGHPVLLIGLPIRASETSGKVLGRGRCRARSRRAPDLARRPHIAARLNDHRRGQPEPARTRAKRRSGGMDRADAPRCADGAHRPFPAGRVLSMILRLMALRN